MPVVLSVSRAAVPQEHEAEYLATLRSLSRALRGRGQRLWVFRHPSAPGTYLECSEGGDARAHRVNAPKDGAESALEARLRALATYEADAWVLWDEVPLEDR
jgi:hypothetical protein